MSTKKAAPPDKQRPTEGFGVPMSKTDPHCFIVRVPQGRRGAVEIVESLGIQAKDDSVSEITRVVLPRPRWMAIRQDVQRTFNNRLKEHKLATSRWKVGENPVDRLLGKELCVLAWAVEQMDEDKIPVAVRNWIALRPEERWWLFSMTAMSTGGVHDGDKGWRVALRYALGDVAQHQLFKPHDVRKRQTERPDLPSLDLFSNDPAKE
ncbi:MAG: anti-phage-associated DUF3780 domain-containing protein [Pseudomonadota bacterium]